jgi:tripartite ATP-independent transporter DctP family solute receptor
VAKTDRVVKQLNRDISLNKESLMTNKTISIAIRETGRPGPISLNGLANQYLLDSPILKTGAIAGPRGAGPSRSKPAGKPLLRRINALLSLLLLLPALLGAGCTAKSDVKVLKLAHALDTSHPVHKSMVYMAKRLDELSGGKMRIDIYPSGQLGGERELIELLQIGSLAMTKVSASPLESFVPEIQIFGIPYVFRDEEHLWKVLNGEIGKQLLDGPKAFMLKGLGYYDAGSRSFYTTRVPIYKPDDLKGLKIRVQESRTAMAMVQALGGAATPVSWGELYTALQQGIVDGAENNPPSLYISRQYEVSKYYSLDEHTAVPDVLIISLRVWESLTPQQQQWLQTAVDESVLYQRKLWAEFSAKALKTMEDAGLTIIHPDKAPFRAAVAGFLRSYEGTPTGELLKKIQAIH